MWVNFLAHIGFVCFRFCLILFCLCVVAFRNALFFIFIFSLWGAFRNALLLYFLYFLFLY
jgi:hypothetical protein